jgi:hypothetical protein
VLYLGCMIELQNLGDNMVPGLSRFVNGAIGPHTENKQTHANTSHGLILRVWVLIRVTARI